MKFFATSALATVLATAAFAYEDKVTPTNVSMDQTGSSMENAELIRSRDITGGAIYTLAGEAAQSWDTEWTYDGVSENLNNIGEIEDIVLSTDGQMKGIVAEIGGFLDIGDKHVMIELDDVKLVAADDQEYAFVTRLSEEQLEELESVDEGFWN